MTAGGALGPGLRKPAQDLRFVQTTVHRRIVFRSLCSLCFFFNLKYYFLVLLCCELNVSWAVFAF